MSAPVDLGHDELDLMDQPIHPSVFFSASAPVKKQSIQPQELRRSLRPRKSVAKLSATPKSQPRKRAMSTGASSSAPPAQKKLKLDERKAVSHWLAIQLIPPAINKSRRIQQSRTRKEMLGTFPGIVGCIVIASFSSLFFLHRTPISRVSAKTRHLLHRCISWSSSPNTLRQGR